MSVLSHAYPRTVDFLGDSSTNVVSCGTDYFGRSRLDLDCTCANVVTSVENAHQCSVESTIDPPSLIDR